MKLRQRLGRQPLAALWMAMGSTTVIELAGSAGADAIIIDAQHGLWDRASLESAVGAVAAGTSALVRVAENTALAIGQALDTGAEGVIVPLVEDGAEAARAVAAARFPPQGKRSGGGVRPLAGGFLDYCAIANERTVLALMIETVRGVNNAAAIARTPGVDLVLIGTGDLALSLGAGAGKNAHEDACRNILQACRDAAIPCAIFTATVEDAVARTREGYAMVIAANDIAVVSSGFGNAMRRFKTDLSSAPPSAGKQRPNARRK
ncbi:MAG TPA: aldolase/citrate lyase family protein [Xanthobacteraceae bacterium]|nr:aldolase/citrate lyase family protein [Xanthobacteraceae bacterium]